MHVLAQEELRLDAGAVDYLLLALYFVFVLGIGYLARRSVSSSLDFFLSGRSLPAWVTGLAFIAANLGAVEIMGMSANGAEYGMPTMHYFWVGAVPAMLFLGIVMMPFYYGSKVRSVPEFMLRRFGKPAHLVNGLSFALAQLLIAGINLFLLATVVNLLLGWPLWLSIILAAVIVLAYTGLGGLSAAIYNEVLQFFVIVAALLPLTIVGLTKVGGWQGLVSKMSAAGNANELSAWPGSELTGFANNALSAAGIVFGLGFVLAFGYWTTNFVEVQRAMASKSMSAARRAPIIGAIPKMLIPFIVVIPGMIAGVATQDIAVYKQTGAGSVDYNDALLVLMRDLLPNGILGIALTGLLASFMAGMAANLSSFNTVFTYDIWQAYVVKDRSDEYYLKMGRRVTVGATVAAVGTACGGGLLLLAAATTVVHFVVVLGYPRLLQLLRRSMWEPQMVRVGYLDGYGVLRNVLNICTSRGWTVLDLQVEREDTDDEQQRTVVVAVRIRGREPTSALVEEVGALPGVLHAAVGETAETSF